MVPHVFFHPDFALRASLSVPEFHRVGHTGSRTLPPIGIFTLP